MAGDAPLEKIVIDLPPGQEASAETIWGIAIGEDRYQLDNVPVWAYGLAYRDVVRTALGQDGRRHYKKVTQKSGLLTIRAAGPDADQAVFRQLCEMLEKNAVASERFSTTYCAFAMEPQRFAALGPEVERAEDTRTIFVEVANDDEEP